MSGGGERFTSRAGDLRVLPVSCGGDLRDGDFRLCVDVDVELELPA